MPELFSIVIKDEANNAVLSLKKLPSEEVEGIIESCMENNEKFTLEVENSMGHKNVCNSSRKSVLDN